MISVKALTVLLISGTALAVPASSPHRHLHKRGGAHDYDVQDIVVATVTNYVDAPAPTPYEAPAPAPKAPKKSHPYLSPAPAPAPAPHKGGKGGKGGESSGDYIDVVNKWRNLMGLPEMTKDEQLESEAVDTCATGGGYGQMEHKLGSGTYAQVLAPADSMDNFEDVFVGGWLCENPALVSMVPDACTKMHSSHWSNDPSSGGAETGHADIISDPKYTTCGCGNSNGVTGCNFGY